MKSNLFLSLLVSGFSLSVFAQEPIQVIEPAKIGNAAKVELGKKLFFDPRLSKSGIISCNSCHNLASSGTDNLPTSIGHGWAEGPINSPTVFNASYNLAQFWDGRAADLKEQAGGPIVAEVEMASSHDIVVKTLAGIPQYQQEFSAVYGKGGIDIDKVTDAIAAFETTLVTPNSDFDLWLKGDNKALSAQQLRGYQTFKEIGCIACHNGPAVGANSYQKMGVVKPYVTKNKSLGRYGVTARDGDKHVFKVPTLRNIELTAPYFHDGAVWDLAEAVNVMAEIQLGKTLTAQQSSDIVAFLKTLTGERPQIVLPLLPPSPDTMFKAGEEVELAEE
ncbi:cytochrome-c peroxidase [Thalassomonas viridans]|uniref:Cytochrome-c peroxidase n=1 Tax=Thalassomonas viridans TaxID=137584 RepID=A0AAE9Z925_9GAMM|nr:cytochrome-c peroxidase [Thalassomonas viridans]WDE07553.1 cytochrome-c peroxidase [Thalassomonas viridans]